MKIKAEKSKVVCVYCRFVFNCNSELAIHIAATHFDNVFHCDICDVVRYETKEEFNAHVESHLRVYSISRGNGVLEVNGRLKLSSFREENKNSFSCNACGRDFTRQNYLNRHVASCLQKEAIGRNTLQYFCDLCDQRFIKRDDLTVHLLKLHQIQDITYSEHMNAETHPFTSNVNHATIELNRNTQLSQPCLVQFQNNETNRQNLILILPACTVINTVINTEEFASSAIKQENTISQLASSNIKQEIAGSYREVEATEIENSLVVVDGQLVYRCIWCQHHVQTRPEFIEHLHIHSGQTSYVCQVCGKQYRSLSLLNNHVRNVHSKVKRFPCDICGRRFAFLRTRDDHRRTHTGECPCICGICGKAFKSKSSLYFHTRFHSNKFPYECAYCDRRYRIRQQLKRHIMSHTGEKTNPCDLCGKAFRFKSGLKKHKLNHESKEEVECQICGKSFSQLRYLKIHVRSHNLKVLNNLPR